MMKALKNTNDDARTPITQQIISNTLQPLESTQGNITKRYSQIETGSLILKRKHLSKGVELV